MKSGWQSSKLGAVTTKIGSGATPLGGEEAYKAAGISLIRSLNVYDSGFRADNLAHIDDMQAEQLSNVTVEPHDVLLNITGPPLPDVAWPRPSSCPLGSISTLPSCGPEGND